MWLLGSLATLALDLSAVGIYGLGTGLLGALATGRVFSGLPFKVRLLLLFDVRPTDPLILGMVSVVLTIVALLACLLPALRAAKVDPMVALRYE
jgi:putative ABC transport system permease protein